MWKFGKSEKIIQWMLPRLRIGEYHRSVSLRNRKYLTVIARYENNENSDDVHYGKNIFYSKHRKFEKMY
jgi:hypothetical protein